MATYPPYQQPLLDRETGLVSKPWHQFFLGLTGGTIDGGTIADGSVPVAVLEPIASPRLLGRGSPGFGPVEQLLVGEGLLLTDTTLSATATGVAAEGYWTPITDGVTPIAELLFDAVGDCVVGFVPTPS